MNRRRWWVSPRATPPPPPPEPPAEDSLLSGPAFFLSYARAKPAAAGERGDPNSGVTKLFTDLNDRVRQLLPLQAGDDAGWMDFTMEAGDRWSDELLRNLGKARVFVALLSAPYLRRSEWCAMEWDYFDRRTVRPRPGAARGPKATAIIPVLWTPVDGPMPRMVSEVQRFGPPPVVTPEHAQLYESEGVLGMSYVDPGAYLAVVWSIARQIQKTCAALEVLPPGSISTQGLRRKFTDGPR